jgi:hypothetical protein
MKPFSFTITQQNFFSFIYGLTSKTKYTPELKARIRKDINDILDSLKIVTSKSDNQENPADEDKPEQGVFREAKGEEELEDPEQLEFVPGLKQTDIIEKYFDSYGQEYSNLSLEEKSAKFKTLLGNVIQKINLPKDAEEYYNNAVSFFRKEAPAATVGKEGANWKATYEDIKNNMFFKKEDGSPFKAVTWNSLEFMAQELGNLNDKFSLAVIFDDNEEVRKRAEIIYQNIRAGKKYGNDESYNESLSYVMEHEKEYITKKQKIINAFKPFFQFVENYKAAEKKAQKEKFKQKVLAAKPDRDVLAYVDSSVEAGKTPKFDKALSSDIRDFWKLVQSSPLVEAKKAENDWEDVTLPKGKTQFDIGIGTAKAVAMISNDSNYDDEYTELIVANAELFASAKANAELFKKWAEPLYRNMHMLTQGINRYFIEDDVSGLSSQDPGAIYAVNQISQESEKIKKTGLKASELTENKDSLKNLTKEAKIVMEILKRMEE